MLSRQRSTLIRDMNPPRLSAEPVVRGQNGFDGDVVSRITGLTPTTVRRQGYQKLQKASESGQHDLWWQWRFLVGPCDTYDHPAVVEHLLSHFVSCREALAAEAQARAWSLSVRALARIETPGNDMPMWEFPAVLLADVASLGASLRPIPLYV